MGTWGATLISLGALISTTGTMLAIILAGPRLLLAMAERGQLPSWFERIHPRFRTPHVGILATSAAGLALGLSGTFTYLLSLSVIARLSTYLGTVIAMLVFRRRPELPEARFTVPAGIAVATIAIASSVWLLTSSGVRELRDVGIACAAGLAFYAIWGRLGPRDRAT